MSAMIHRRTLLASLAMAGFGITAALAQEPWPNRTGKVMVPYPAGGATDVMGRFAAEALSQATSQRFIVENKGGASGALGSADVERAAPDGHTLLVATPATHVTNQYLRPKLPYDPDNFASVVMLSQGPLLLVAHPGLPANTVAELIALAKQRPGKLNYGSSGVGATSHLAPELFKAMAGVEITHVPYRGAGPAMADLIGGQVELMFDNVQTALPQIEAGKVKVLGVTSAQRLASLPDVPAISETVKGYEALSFLALMAPKGTPAPVIGKINAIVTASFQTPDIKAKLGALGVEFAPNTPAELDGFIGREREKWGALIRERGLKADQ
jgi:tripartite-type tricarboxylate transporter receptor subunit TctC